MLHNSHRNIHINKIDLNLKKKIQRKVTQKSKDYKLVVIVKVPQELKETEEMA